MNPIRTLSHADAAWLHMDLPNNPMVINGLFYLDRAPERRRFEQVLEERFLAYERFRMKVVEAPHGLGRPHWELDPDFSLARHLHWEELAEPTHQKLMERTGQLMGQPLDRRHPLWEFRVFPEVDQGAVVLVRLHHAIGDGMALMQVLLNLTDDEQGTPSGLPPRRERHHGSLVERAKKTASHLLHEGHDLIFHPEQAMKIARQGMGAVRALGRLLRLGADPDTVLKRDLGGEKHAAVSPLLELTTIKAVGKRFGCTINDVLMATLSGALGRYLNRNGPPTGPDLDLRAVVPVDLRGGDVGELGNRFGMVFLELPVGEPDPVERLRVVHRRMQELKGSAEAVVIFEILSAVGMLPSELEKVVVGLFGEKATAVVTNLPGPRQQLHMAGTRIESLMYWVPQSGGLGLGISLLSYNGTVRVGVASDAALTRRPQQFIDDFEAAFAELAELEDV